MRNDEVIAANKISIWCSIIAILVCIGWLVYEFVSKRNDYMLWVVLLLMNVSVLFSNINNKKQ